MEQLLIIEDDRGLNQGLCKALKADNRQIFSCQDLKTAREQLLCGSVSLILLDILDFEKHEKTLYEIIAYVKETYPEALPSIVPLLDFSKMKEEKHRMLKDDRFDRRAKKQFSELINLLIEHSDEISVIKLQEIKNLKQPKA